MGKKRNTALYAHKESIREAEENEEERKENVPVGKAFIQATYNNPYHTDRYAGECDIVGIVGRRRFQGSRKSTPFAAQMAAKVAAQKAIDTAGLRSVEVLVKGPGIGREAPYVFIANRPFVTKIKDITPIPHNVLPPAKKAQSLRGSRGAIWQSIPDHRASCAEGR